MLENKILCNLKKNVIYTSLEAINILNNIYLLTGDNNGYIHIYNIINKEDSSNVFEKNAVLISSFCSHTNSITLIKFIFFI